MSELVDSLPDTETGEKDTASLWERWKISEGKYAPPEPERFTELAHNIRKGDMPQMASASVRYALERTGLLLSPQQLSEPLERLNSTADELERARVVNSFLEYCDIADEIADKVEQASDLASGYSFDQIRIDLPEVTRGSDGLAAIQVVKKMHESKDPAFERVGSLTKSHATAILRVMYGWEKGLDLPEPAQHLKPVS